QGAGRWVAPTAPQSRRGVQAWESAGLGFYVLQPGVDVGDEGGIGDAVAHLDIGDRGNIRRCEADALELRDHERGRLRGILFRAEELVGADGQSRRLGVLPVAGEVGIQGPCAIADPNDGELFAGALDRGPVDGALVLGYVDAVDLGATGADRGLGHKLT